MSQPRPPAASGLAPPGLATTDWAALVRTHQAEVWRYLRYLGADATEADDLTQETFLVIARSALVEESPQQTAGYLRTTARRQLLMLRRKQKRRCETENLEAAESVWAASFTSNPWDDHVEAARGCVEKLEGRVRRAIDLSYRESQSREAIAEALGLTADGVKTLLRRTREKLRACIEAALRRSAPPTIP